MQSTKDNFVLLLLSVVLNKEFFRFPAAHHLRLFPDGAPEHRTIVKTGRNMSHRKDAHSIRHFHIWSF